MVKRYSSYKDSGVEWIGEIPSGWSITKLKMISKLQTGNTPPKIDSDNYEGGMYLWIKPDELNGLYPTNETKENLTEKGKSLSRVVPPYSPLVNCIGDIGKIGYSEVEVSTNQQITSVIFHKSIHNRYGLYHSFVMKDEYKRNSECVVVPILNNQKQGDCFFVKPPLNEQKQIVEYLDEKTTSIDTLIQSKKKKISLLKEKRTSLINQVVTKGLNPNVEMKDSGVEWIGEIPREWKFLPTKYFTFEKNGIQTGPFGTQLNTKDYVDFGVKVMNQKTLINEDYEIGEEFISYEKFKKLKGFEVVGGDLIMGTRGSFGSGKRTTFGKVSIVPNELGDCVLHPCLIRIRLKEDLILKNYYSYYVNDSTFFLENVRNTSNSTTIEVIYGITLRDIRIPLPPLSEQKQIVDYLDRETELIDKTVSIEERKVEVLKEYKQSLISEVVTGKRKVISDD